MKTTIANPINTTNAMGKKRKRPKNAHKGKKDEENILSKDLDDDNIRYMMDTKKNIKPREDLKSSFTLKNLRFKPQKYKGSFLPYHLRWIFNNNVKTNEIVLLQEIEGLENEINRLKCLKLVNRECRKLAGFPFGINTIFCQCCRLFDKKKHDCTHKYCNNNCSKKKQEELMQNLLKATKLKPNNPSNNANKSDSKDKQEKNQIFKNENYNVNNNEQNNNQQNYIIDLSKNNNNNKNENIIQEPIISLGKKINNIRNEIISSNEIIRVNTIPSNRQLIFGVVRPKSKERRGIFLVKSDNFMGSSNTIYDFGEDSSDDSNQIKINSESGENEIEINNNIKEDNKDIKDKKKNFEISNYTVSIESDEIDEPEEVININNDNEEDKVEKIEENNNEENKENKEIKENKDIKDKEEEDDIIIINQTSPHNSDIEI